MTRIYIVSRAKRQVRLVYPIRQEPVSGDQYSRILNEADILGVRYGDTYSLRTGKTDLSLGDSPDTYPELIAFCTEKLGHSPEIICVE